MKSNKSGLIIVCALVIGVIRAWMQFRGTTKTPFVEWAIGFGAFFFIVSLIAGVSPEAAAALALLVTVADFLQNGVSLTTDISSVIGNAPGMNTTPKTTKQLATPTNRNYDQSHGTTAGQ